MKDQVIAAMPACFENWCCRFDDIFSRQKQRQAFRIYLGGLLGESQRKNLVQMTNNTVDGCYNSIRHFLNEAPWDVDRLNTRRLQVMQSCRQTTPNRRFTLIVDDSGHRKSGDATDGVGRQYIGEIGKTDNGIVLLTTNGLHETMPLHGVGGCECAYNFAQFYYFTRKLQSNLALNTHASTPRYGIVNLALK